MRERKAGILVFLTLAVSYAYFFQGGGWNPNSRLDLTRALASGDGLVIDRFVRNTGDWAYHEGHYYTNKSPGLSFLALPAFLLTNRLNGNSESVTRLRRSAYAANLAVNASSGALLGFLVYRAIMSLSLGTAVWSAWLALVFGLGTLIFPYATAFYGHQPAAASSFAGFALVNTARTGEKRAPYALVAGAAFGVAIVLELSTVLVLAAVTFVLLLRPAERRLCPWVLAGSLPVLAALGAYYYLCFGSPFSTGYAHSNPAVMVAENGRLFGAPRPGRVVALLLSPRHGILFSSPMLALAPLGMVELFRRDRLRALVCGLVPVAFLLLVSSFHGWQGGWAPGPRYLVPSLPFLFLPVAAAARRASLVFFPLALVSVTFMLGITAVGVEVPAGVGNPLRDFVLPSLLKGKISVNPQGLDDYLPPLSYLRLAPPENWNSFNLGELFFPHSTASLLPLLAIWLGAAATLRRLARRRINMGHRA